jgi:DNA-binding response OmpR family regulator
MNTNDLSISKGVGGELKEVPARLIALEQTIITQEVLYLTTDTYALGRSLTCDLVANDKRVSRLHARLERRESRYILSDAGSGNGTFVNGQRIFEPHLLTHDDLIGLGSNQPLLRFVDPESTMITHSVLQYNERRMQFLLDGKVLELAPLQFRLLRHLYQHVGTLCTRESCAQAIWGRDYEPGMDAGALDQSMASLRRSLKAISPDADWIETQRGVGYMLVLP